jgi:hypothetical protein
MLDELLNVIYPIHEIVWSDPYLKEINTRPEFDE